MLLVIFFTFPFSKVSLVEYWMIGGLSETYKVTLFSLHLPRSKSYGALISLPASTA